MCADVPYVSDVRLRGHAVDVVYVVRKSDINHELRLSLRSIAANLDGLGTVWIAGYTPNWVTGVRSINVRQSSTRWRNSTANLRAAVAEPELSDRFLLMNDDYYLLRRCDIADVPVWHRGDLTALVKAWRRVRGERDQFTQGAAGTLDLLRELGHDRPLSYEVHVPFPVDKTAMGDALRLPAKLGHDVPALHKRTLYGNVTQAAGKRITRDPKLKLSERQWPEHWTWLSTAPGQAEPRNPVGRRLHRMFSSPCRFERHVPRR